jgi:two-component system phosphate regulon response regulator OmpR
MTQEYKSQILIVDDDNRIVKLLKKFFEQHNFLISSASSVKEAEELLQYCKYDLMILDVMLPGITGLEFAHNIRSQNHKMPIIMLTALCEPRDRIRGLESGANDYLTKPFEPKELLLRVQNLIDAYSQHKKLLKIKHFGKNCYDLFSKEFTNGGRLIKLSYTEQKLLEIFIERQDQIVTRSKLSKQMGGISLRSIDVQIARLRIKIEDNPKEPTHLKTIRNEGYSFVT